MEIRHYYHIWSDGRNWLEPLSYHLNKIIESGFYEEAKPVRIGFTGNPSNTQKVKDYLVSRGIEFISVAEELCCWEQVTLNQLYFDACEEDFKVFYAHTKGASFKPISDLSCGYRDLLNRYWREDMTDGLFSADRWKRAETLLDSYDTVGTLWMKEQNFWAGNFWAATSEYIRSIGHPDESNRHDAEAWIRKNRSLRAYDMQPGFPTFSRLKPITDGKEVFYWENPLRKELGMKVTFRSDSHILGYKPGRIYVDELTPLLKTLLNKGTQLVLIDPPSLDMLIPEPEPVVLVRYPPVPDTVAVAAIKTKEVSNDSHESSTDTKEPGSSSGSSSDDGGNEKSAERPSGSKKTSS